MDTTWLLRGAVVASAIYDSPQPPGSSEYSSYTVQFVGGQLVANDGCNTIQIAATLDARTVTTFGDITSTGAACRDSALRIAYDRELLKTSLGWQVSGTGLTLTTRGGDIYHFELCRRRAGTGSADDFACLGPSR
ncbi:MAG: META domain-containing protein [Actinomycetota bacterium]|nr:META domain-containing protein [Actinomycetota bacterium]